MTVYSYSRIECFENCPRQFKFRYIEKPPIEKIETVEAFLGKRAHETLERCFRMAQQGYAMKREELTILFEKLWQENHPEKVKVVREDMALADYFAIGRKALEAFHARHYPFDREQTLGLELPVHFALDDEGKFRMTGFVDRLARGADGRLRIHDYKTSRTLPTQQGVDADRQLALYQIAISKKWPTSAGIELVWHYLQFDTELASVRSQEQLELLRETYIAKIRRIEKAMALGNFPTHESNLCNWCEYFDLCPAKGGAGSPVQPEKMTKKLTEPEKTALVDEYILLNMHKKEIEDRMEPIREQLAELGEVGSSKFLRGSHNDGVIVTLAKIQKLPMRSSDPEQAAEVEALIRQVGLYDEYSVLDMQRVQKALTSGDLPDEIEAQLKPYQSEVISDRMRIKKGDG